MIVDSLQNTGKYANLHTLFAKAFAYINSIDLANLEVGKFDIDGDSIRGIVSDQCCVTAPDSVAKFECHIAHIDIHVCIRGKEQMCWKQHCACV